MALRTSGSETQSTIQRTESGVAATAAAEMHPVQDALAYVREYAREKPDAAALWCFGLGFVAGWKLKLW